MFKKISILTFMVMIVLCMTMKVFAIEQFNLDQRVQMAVVTNTESTVVSEITVHNRILGYRFVDSIGGKIFVFDTATSESTDSNTIIVDGCRAGDSTGDWFAYPYQVSSGIITVNVGGTGELIIYYE